MNEDCNVRGKLEEILSEQCSRLLASGSLDDRSIKSALQELSKKRLTPELIEEDLCKELKLICSYRYDCAMLSSNRLEGFGWSLEHMKKHMKRVLKSKMNSISTVFRTHMKVTALES